MAKPTLTRRDRRRFEVKERTRSAFLRQVREKLEPKGSITNRQLRRWAKNVDHEFAGDVDGWWVVGRIEEVTPGVPGIVSLEIKNWRVVCEQYLRQEAKRLRVERSRLPGGSDEFKQALNQAIAAARDRLPPHEALTTRVLRRIKLRTDGYFSEAKRALWELEQRKERESKQPSRRRRGRPAIHDIAWYKRIARAYSSLPPGVPKRTLAPQFGLSDTAFRSVIRRCRIPADQPGGLGLLPPTLPRRAGG